MSYSLKRFLKPLNGSEKTIKIYDDRNFPVHTINPFSVLRIFVSNNNLSIALSGNRTIVLDFPNNEECKISLAKLQTYIDRLKQNTPVVIDKDKANYIEQAILGAPGLNSLNGSTASSQTIAVYGDANIGIGISKMESANPNLATHNLSITWTGILPMDRGGLNNSVFTPNELLISSTASVVSSGYSINDSGTASTDIWTAAKIIQHMGSTMVNKETPAGSVNGTNNVFVLAHVPVDNSEHVYLNGLLQDSDLGADYTMDGNMITFAQAPFQGSKIRCTYMAKEAQNI